LIHVQLLNIKQNLLSFLFY